MITIKLPFDLNHVSLFIGIISLKQNKKTLNTETAEFF